MGIVINQTRLKPQVAIKSVSGEFISIDDALAKPVEGLSINFAPNQDLHGYASPWIDNVYDKVPYNSRSMSAVGVSRLGTHEYDKIIGCSYDWNQLYTRSGSTGTNGGITYTNNGDGSWTIQGTCDPSASTASRRKQIQSPSLHPYHVHWVSSRAVGTGAEYVQMVLSRSGGNVTYSTAYKGRLYKSSVNYTQFSFRVMQDNAVVDCVAKPQIIDLTKVFGAEVADYIFNLGQDDGIALLQSLFPNEMYEPVAIYNNGGIKNVNVSSHIMRDSGGNAIGTYALDSSLQLRGVLKLDANNKLYCDGDVYASNGTVTRKYASIDMSTLTWGYVTEGVEKPVFVGSAINGVVNDPSVIYDAVINRGWVFIPFNNITLTGHDDSIAISDDGTKVYIQDSSYTDVTTFANTFATIPTELIYKLGTPTTESATPFTSAQAIDASGSEEYVDYAESQGLRDVAIPVGHESNYANICPISGYEGLTFSQSDLVLNGSDISFSVGNIGDTGADTSGSGYKRSEYIDVKKISVLTFILDVNYSGGWIFRICGYDGDKNFVELFRKSTIASKGQRIITLDMTNIAYLRFAVVRADVDTTLYGDLTTIPVSWQTEAGTVMGGMLNLLTGVLTKTHTTRTFDGSSDESISTYTTNRMRLGVSDFVSPATSKVADIKCDKLRTVNKGSSSATTYMVICGSDQNRNEMLINVGFNTVNEVRTWLSENPIQVVYKLKTNQSIQLSPHQISTLMGSNRLWTDVGTISLDYWGKRSSQSNLLGGMLGSPQGEPEEAGGTINEESI